MDGFSGSSAYAEYIVNVSVADVHVEKELMSRLMEHFIFQFLRRVTPKEIQWGFLR